MASNLLNINLVQGVLKTIMVFDTLNTNLNLKELEDHLLDAQASEQEILHVLDFLCAEKVIYKDDNRYCLYIRQEDTRRIVRKHRFNLAQKALLPVFCKIWDLDGISLIDNPGQPPLLMISFQKEVSPKRKEFICQVMAKVSGIHTAHVGIIPRKLRNALTATLLASAKPVVNLSSLEQFWRINSWIFSYCSNSKTDYSVSLTNNNVSRSKNGGLGTFKSYGVNNVSTYLKQVMAESQFENNIEQLQTYTDQWILPNIKHAIKRHQIV